MHVSKFLEAFFLLPFCSTVGNLVLKKKKTPELLVVWTRRKQETMIFIFALMLAAMTILPTTMRVGGCASLCEM